MTLSGNIVIIPALYMLSAGHGCYLAKLCIASGGECPGICISVYQVFSSIRAAHSVLTSQRLRPVLLLHPNALPEFDGLDTSDPDAVVVGLAKEAFSYTNMNQAFRLLMDKPDAPLIAIHKGK